MSMSQVYTPYILQMNSSSNIRSTIDNSYQMMNQYPTTISNYTNYGELIDQNMIALAYLNAMNSQKTKVKTSLCKKWAENGNCPYGYKCQFAHGIAELRCNVGENFYKTKQCNAFFRKGYCPYGDRCNFLHKQIQNMFQESEMNLKQSQTNSNGYRQIIQIGKMAQTKGSKLLTIMQRYPDQSDQKSVASTQQSKSQNLSRSRIGMSSYQMLNQFSQNSNSIAYSDGQNIIYGNIAQGNLYANMYFPHLPDETSTTDNELQKQIEDKNEDEGLHLFNIDNFY